MNLMELLDLVSETTESATKEELQFCIHEFARKWPSDEREEFLSFLRLCLKKDECDAEDIVKDDEWYINQIIDLQESLECIELKEEGIVAEINEDYDDWYNPDDDEFYYYDPNHIFDKISKGMAFIDDCYNEGKYSYAYHVGKSLLHTTKAILVEGDYFQEEKSLEDFSDLGYGCNKEDYKDFIVKLCVCAYMHVDMKERPYAICDIMQYLAWYNFSLNAILQTANTELPNLQEFFKVWLAYLASKKETAVRELEEAIDLVNNQEYCFDIAKQYTNIHPGLYKLCFDKFNLNEEQGLNVMLDALDSIDHVYKVRSSVALSAADLALSLNKRELAENCWFEAFRSNTTVTNYLRLILETKQPDLYREKARDVYISMDCVDRVISYGLEADKNILTKSLLSVLQFFDGNIKPLIETDDYFDIPYFNNTTVLHLMMIYKVPVDHVLRYTNHFFISCHQLIDFTQKAYYAGLHREIESNLSDEELFRQIYRKWCKQIGVLSNFEDYDVLTLIDNSIKVITYNTLSNHYRNSYGTCACYIANFGELLEALGQTGAKQELLDAYASEYSRFRRFHRELEAHGW